jgi:hypothetical protein
MTSPHSREKASERERGEEGTEGEEETTTLKGYGLFSL